MNSTGQDQVPKLSAAQSRLRSIVVALVIAGIVCLFAYAGGWLTPHALLPKHFVDRFENVNGVSPGFRRNHAKGLCFSGWFDSNGQGVTLSKAVIFRSGRVPIIGRFSLSGGKPYVGDASTTVRGMAILFKLPDGEEWRMAMINLPVFPFATPEAFYDQMLALAPDPTTGKPAPAKTQAFLAKYPESAAAIQLIHSHPMSSGFGNSTYSSLNAFRFINASDAVTSVRWSMTPAQPFAPMDPAPSPETSTNFLFDALIASIHKQPLQWHLIITIAQPGDRTDDATIPWPSDRQQIDAGTLTIDRVESEDSSPARDINFDPLILPNGVAPSDDPLLSARSAVYSRSFTRREGEHKTPSAISTTETGNAK